MSNHVVTYQETGIGELDEFLAVAAKIAEDYPQAVGGVKKRATEARKGLMAIKKMATKMRKSALDKCKAAREDKE